MNNCKKCNSTNIVHVEMMWDYDWVLYIECKDCQYKENRHTWKPFTIMKSKEEYWYTYFFWKDWKLNSYSIYPAEWLNVDDDLTLIENTLWGSRWEDWTSPMMFRPIKHLSLSHIENILADWIVMNEEMKQYFINKLSNESTRMIQEMNYTS